MKLQFKKSLGIAILFAIGCSPSYSTGDMKINISGSVDSVGKTISVNQDKSKNVYGVFKHSVLRFSKYIIPSSAKTETGNGVYEFYEPVWEQLLTANQSQVSLVKNGVLILRSSLWAFMGHYVYGDFNGLCIRQRIAHIFKRGV